MRYDVQDVVRMMHSPDFARSLVTSEEEMEKLSTVMQRAKSTGDYSEARSRSSRVLRNTIRDVFNTLLDLRRSGRATVTAEEMQRAKEIMGRSEQTADFAQVIPIFMPLLDREVRAFDESTLKRCETLKVLTELQRRLLNSVLLMSGLDDQQPASPMDSGYYSSGETKGGRKRPRKRTKAKRPKRSNRKRPRSKKKNKKTRR